MNTKCAMLPGTFDPPTVGHMDIIERCALLYDKLYVVIADNINKSTLFTSRERKAMLEELLSRHKNIEVCIWSGLVVDFAKEHDTGVIVRGVRAMNDFGYEFELAMTYKQMCPDVEVLFIPTDPKYFLIRSSSIKEMAVFGADISKMVPKLVGEKVKEKLKQLT
ncbi:MAG: pantetheine-phosphate adenylyltransferase [Spirochaetales bacterium]|nr:pantetheine-phosphate adenylyltransferase [Spirochaetales bacterium]MBO4717403.1 pantetheine-phosphate adenylyltransferase [Spirochaetales bacterium]